MKEANNATAQFHAVTIRVNNLYEWIRVVTEMEAASFRKIAYKGTKILGPKWLYRGQANSGWEISSGFEREISSKIPVSIKDKEKYLRSIEQFGLRNFKRWVEVPDSYLQATTGEWLALMQHYGVPTRLVDFTEVPLVALGFALEYGTQAESDFAVWAILRYTFNSIYNRESICQRLSEENTKVELCDDLESRVQTDTSENQFFEKIMDGKEIKNLPKCLLEYNPVRMNRRQKLQRGLFLACSYLSERFMPLLHSWTDTCAADLNNPKFKMQIDNVLKSNGKFVDTVANAHLVKFVFCKKLRQKARMLLRCCNIGERTRYGDNDSLASETKDMMLEYV